jgi:hypothetical protein
MRGEEEEESPFGEEQTGRMDQREPDRLPFSACGVVVCIFLEARARMFVLYGPITSGISERPRREEEERREGERNPLFSSRVCRLRDDDDDDDKNWKKKTTKK